MDKKLYLQKWKKAREEWEESKKVGEMWLENELKSYKSLALQKDAFVEEKNRYDCLIVQTKGNISKFAKKVEEWGKNNPQLLFSLQAEDVLLRSNIPADNTSGSPQESSNLLKEWKGWHQVVVEEQKKIKGLLEAQNQVQQKIDQLEKKSALLRKLPQQRAQKHSILKILTALSIGAAASKNWPEDKEISWKQSGTIQDIKKSIPFLRNSIDWQDPSGEDRYLQNICAAICLIYEGQLYDEQALNILNNAKRYINDPSVELLTSLATELKGQREGKNALKYDLGEVMWEMSKE